MSIYTIKLDVSEWESFIPAKELAETMAGPAPEWINDPFNAALERARANNGEVLLDASEAEAFATIGMGAASHPLAKIILSPEHQGASAKLAAQLALQEVANQGGRSNPMFPQLTRKLAEVQDFLVQNDLGYCDVCDNLVNAL